MEGGRGAEARDVLGSSRGRVGGWNAAAARVPVALSAKMRSVGQTLAWALGSQWFSFMFCLCGRLLHLWYPEPAPDSQGRCLSNHLPVTTPREAHTCALSPAPSPLVPGVLSISVSSFSHPQQEIGPDPAALGLPAAPRGEGSGPQRRR